MITDTPPWQNVPLDGTFLNAQTRQRPMKTTGLHIERREGLMVEVKSRRLEGVCWRKRQRCLVISLSLHHTPDLRLILAPFIRIPSSSSSSPPFDSAVSSQIPSRLSESCLKAQGTTFLQRNSDCKYTLSLNSHTWFKNSQEHAALFENGWPRTSSISVLVDLLPSHPVLPRASLVLTRHHYVIDVSEAGSSSLLCIYSFSVMERGGLYFLFDLYAGGPNGLGNVCVWVCL